MHARIHLPTAQGAAALAHMCTENSYLRLLDLSSNKLNSKGLEHVTAAIAKVSAGLLESAVYWCLVVLIRLLAPRSSLCFFVSLYLFAILPFAFVAKTALP